MQSILVPHAKNQMDCLSNLKRPKDIFGDARSFEA